MWIANHYNNQRKNVRRPDGISFSRAEKRAKEIKHIAEDYRI